VAYRPSPAGAKSTFPAIETLHVLGLALIAATLAVARP
jgi:hypothetical protein